MKALRLLPLALAIPLAMTSCETTGDPTQGGLFGWSENKAQYRVADKRATLYDIERDTDRQVRRSSYLESERNRLESQR